MYTTVRKLGPKILYYRGNYGPNSLMVRYVDPLCKLRIQIYGLGFYDPWMKSFVFRAQGLGTGITEPWFADSRA